jgi:hypothetical protein
MGQPLVLLNRKIQLVLYLIIYIYILTVMTPVITYSLHNYTATDTRAKEGVFYVVRTEKL